MAILIAVAVFINYKQSESLNMLKFFMISDMCEHEGSSKNLTIFPNRMEISCGVCGLHESHPIGTPSFKQVHEDACLRMIGVDFSPYMQPKPEESTP